jgi:hypothetical protein
MRILVGALLLSLLVLPAAAGHGEHGWPPRNHSANVTDFYWTPREPQRGDAVQAVLTVRGGTDPQAVLLTVCRVQQYACRTPFEMERVGGSHLFVQYKTLIPWDAKFYRGVEQVGFNVILRWPNGTEEKSPVASWPEPAALPEGAGDYYFHHLPPESRDAPGVGLAAILVAAAVTVLRRRP